MEKMNKHLLKEEKILYSARRHWIVFIKPALWTLLSVALISQNNFLMLLSAVTFVIAISSWLKASIDFLKTEYILTDKRLVQKKGIINHELIETFLHKIEEIAYKQTFFGRQFNFGTLTIRGGGMNNIFHQIDRPLIFRRRMQEQIDSLEKK